MIADAGGDGTKDSICVNSKAKIADCSPGPVFRGLTPVRMGRLAHYIRIARFSKIFFPLEKIFGGQDRTPSNDT